ncbi:MAG TPA: beta-galactosidase trimerization domain-containing protein, partial [Mycobacterium sp.]
PSDVANMDRRSYHTIFEAFYRGTFEAGVPARLLHDEHLVGADGAALIDPAELAAELPVLIVPGLLVADNALLDWLRANAAAGGHLVLGPRTAYGDQEGRARTEVKPARLADAAGVRYQEFSNLNDPLPVLTQSDGFALSAGATATRWVDGLIADGGEVLVGYDHPHFGRFPAVVSHTHGEGRITTVGTVPNPALGADLARWLTPTTPKESWGPLPESVTVHSATNRDGQRIHVVHNWSWQPATLTLPHPMVDILNENSEPTEQINLGAWDVRVLAAD